jgi:hypothetical protein
MTQVVDECRRTWRRLGVPREVADEMAADLEADLAAGAAEGYSPAAVIGTDTTAFAAAWATERGVVRPRLRLALTATAALIGAIPGAGFALFVVYGLSSDAMAEIFDGDVIRVGETAYEPSLSPPDWLLLALYALGAVFAYAGAVGAVAAALHLRLDPVVGRTVRRLAATLPVATVAAVGATILYSSTTNFSTDFNVVVTDVVIATTVFAASAALVRFDTVRRERARLIVQRA